MSYYKTKLNISFDEKDIAKKYGAQWDSKEKYWYMFHFDEWNVDYHGNTQGFESLQNINQIAKALKKDIFEIIPQYKNKEDILSEVIELHARQMGGIWNESDVLYHPDTYLEDLYAAKRRIDDFDTTGICPRNHEYLVRMQKIVSNNYSQLIDQAIEQGYVTNIEETEIDY